MSEKCPKCGSINTHIIRSTPNKSTGEKLAWFAAAVVSAFLTGNSKGGDEWVCRKRLR